jgi:hypothetical protein
MHVTDKQIVIFHTKYPKYFRASLRSAHFFYVRPPNLKSWIRPWICVARSILNLVSDDTKGVIKSRK